MASIEELEEELARTKDPVIRQKLAELTIQEVGMELSVGVRKNDKLQRREG